MKNATFAISLALTGAAFGQAKIQVGCTATSDCASVMVAIDQGIFKKHDVCTENLNPSVAVMKSAQEGV